MPERAYVGAGVAVVTALSVVAGPAVVAAPVTPGVAWGDRTGPATRAVHGTRSVRYGQEESPRSWPVAGPPGAPRPVVVRGWDPPASPWGAGHRGVDLSTAVGAQVRSAAAGWVSFAGRVAGRGVVAVTLRDSGEPPKRVTYEPVRATVEVGDAVRAGEVLGHVQDGPFHCARACLHWGLLRGEAYLDPVTLLPERMVRVGRFRLLPFLDVPVPQGPGRVSRRRR